MVRVTTAALNRPWSGVAGTNIVDVLHRACAADPAAPAFVFEDGLVVSRGDLQTRVESFGGYLATRLDAGARIAVMLGKGLYCLYQTRILLALGVQLLGGGLARATHLGRNPD